MARRRNNSISQQAITKRNRASPPRTLPHRDPLQPHYKTVYRFEPLLTQYEDRRTWHPDKLMRPAFAFRRDARRIVEKPLDKARKGFMPSFKLGFQDPSRVVKCIRRKERRETLFALLKTGKGAKRRHRKRDEFSDISCRRT